MCYRSKFPEVTNIEPLRSSVVVEELKRKFGVHGIPAEVVPDNGPQFSNSEFQEFAKAYGFKHATSSPHYMKANGEVERTVHTLKTLWRRNSDKYRVLLDYRTTPIPDIELSLPQLLMKRRLRNILATFRLQYEDDYEYEFSVLSTRFRFGWRKLSKSACSELKTRTRSRPRTPI